MHLRVFRTAVTLLCASACADPDVAQPASAASAAAGSSGSAAILVAQVSREFYIAPNRPLTEESFRAALIAAGVDPTTLQNDIIDQIRGWSTLAIALANLGFADQSLPGFFHRAFPDRSAVKHLGYGNAVGELDKSAQHDAAHKAVDAVAGYAYVQELPGLIAIHRVLARAVADAAIQAQHAAAIEKHFYDYPGERGPLPLLRALLATNTDLRRSGLQRLVLQSAVRQAQVEQLVAWRYPLTFRWNDTGADSPADD